MRMWHLDEYKGRALYLLSTSRQLYCSDWLSVEPPTLTAPMAMAAVDAAEGVTTSL